MACRQFSWTSFSLSSSSVRGSRAGRLDGSFAIPAIENFPENINLFRKPLALFRDCINDK
jgi:hypothetical protein